MRDARSAVAQSGIFRFAGEAIPGELPPILRVSDLSRILGIGEEGVRGLIRRGVIPAARIGKRYLVRRERFYQFLAEHEGRGPEARAAAGGPPHHRGPATPSEAGL